MGSMRSLVYVAPRQVEWREVPDAVLLADTDALVRPTAAAFCDLDPRIARGATPFPGPFPLGHEAMGVVAEVGPEAARAGLAAGQRVVIPFYLSCGTCAHCVAGRRLNCTRTPRMASYGNPLGGIWGGLFDDLVRVPFAGSAVVPVPDSVSSVQAASVGDNLTDAYVAVGPALAERPGASVLVLGGTPSLSLLVVALAIDLGGHVTFADVDPDRCALARRLGATIVEGPLPDRVDGEFDLVVEAHGDPGRGPGTAVRSVAPGGRCHFRCVYFDDVTLPYFDLIEKGVTVEVGLPQIQTHAPAVLGLLDHGPTRVDEVLRRPVAWESAPDALLERFVGKAVFTRDDAHV